MTKKSVADGNGQVIETAERLRQTSILDEQETPTAKPESAPTPFDPAKLRLTQDYSATVGVKKVLTTVQTRKPNRQEFVRVRTGEEWRLETVAFEDKINRETFLVDPSLWSEMAGEVYPVCLFLAVNRQSDVFLWPCKLPGSDGRSNSWNDSALAAARLAETKWVRLSANMGAGLYDVFEAGGNLDGPKWPEITFNEVLTLAFKQRFINTPDHPILKQLRGE